MPKSFLIKQKATKKYSRDQCCYPDYAPYFCTDDTTEELDSPPFGYEKIYDLGRSRDASDDHKLSEADNVLSWRSLQDVDHGGYEKNYQVPVKTSNSISPPTPSMFYDNPWITQSTLFPFSFHDFDRRPLSEATEREPMENQKSQFQCSTCKMEFDTRGALEEHTKSTHASTNRNYTCEFCNKSFSRSWNYQRHILIHKGEKPHKCEKCPKAFVLAAHLKIHNRIHTGEKPYTCEVCSRGFAQLTNLQRHVLTHTGQKPHKCSYCPKGFVSSSDLRRHVRTHTGEKPYQCKVCPKAFTTSGNLHSHMLTHSGERPFQCKICKWKFISSSNLRTHVRIHHKRSTGTPYQDTS